MADKPISPSPLGSESDDDVPLLPLLKFKRRKPEELPEQHMKRWIDKDDDRLWRFRAQNQGMSWKRFAKVGFSGF
jgi:hypothetical protein